MRLIDADALRREIHCEYSNDLEILDHIDAQPTITPEIIRCKDCKYAELTFSGEVKYCDFWQTEDPIYMSADNFCSNAERRKVTT